MKSKETDGMAMPIAFGRQSTKSDHAANKKKCKLRARRFLIEHRHLILKARGAL